MKRLIVAGLAAFFISSLAFANAPSTFSAAKTVAKNKVFYDQASTGLGDLYCGCAWEWLASQAGELTPPRAATRRGLSRHARSGSNGSTSSQPGSSATSGSAGRTEGGSTAWRTTRCSEQWRPTFSISTHPWARLTATEVTTSTGGWLAALLSTEHALPEWTSRDVRPSRVMRSRA